MQTTIRAKAGDLKFIAYSGVEEAISKYEKYHIKCDILSSELKILSKDYILLLDGDRHNIDNYISFLRLKGFKIKKVK